MEGEMSCTRAFRLFAIVIVVATGCDGVSGCGQDTGMVEPRVVAQNEAESRLAAREEAAHSLNQFTFELHKQIAGDGNAVYSPLGIHAVLSMSMAGASGTTADQMRDVLRADGVEDYHAKLGALNWYIGSSSEATIRTAHDLWMHQGLDARKTYADRLLSSYGAAMRSVDFQDPDTSAERINGFVETVTSGLIEEVVSPADIGPLTAFVLSSVIYFDADWKEPFDEKKTSEQPFFVSDDKSVPVDMMHQENTFRYAFSNGVSVVELPYKGTTCTAIGILPQEETLEELEARLDAGLFATLREHLRKVPNLPVSIPRVTLESTFTLRDVLRTMGIEAAFEIGSADFSGVSSEPLYISQVRHAAVFDLDESGVTAAAATVAEGEAAAAERMPEFIANRPFLFFIVDDATGAIVFVARIVDPGGA
jgi:serpin B